MTPEQKHALERLRRLADHPADDDEPVTLEDIYRAARMHDLYIHCMGGQQYALRIVGKCVPIKTSSQLRALLKGLGK